MRKKPIAFALISFACPVIAYVIVETYQAIRDAEFWNTVTPEYSFVAAMMAVGEFGEMVSWLLLSNLIGIIFAGLSFWTRHQFRGLGIAALIFNSLPILLILLWRITVVFQK